jgi:hypothetical protein
VSAVERDSRAHGERIVELEKAHAWEELEQEIERPGSVDVVRVLSGGHRRNGAGPGPGSGPDPRQQEPAADRPRPQGASERPWPDPPGAAAFSGLAGEVVDALDPHTEADRVAVLVHLLVAFGCAAGSTPRMLVGAEEHRARLFAAIVGRTSKARKGSAWAPVRKLFEEAVPQWTADRLQGGVSTGEGLIEKVRDDIVNINAKGEATVIPGVEDKRLFLLESELSRILKVTRRDGNILSEIIRQAWDTGDLRTITRASSLRATGAHVGVVGHITMEELRRELAATDQANGFANRFLWVLARRSKELPEPMPLDGEVLEQLSGHLKHTLRSAREIEVMQRDAQASALWREVYHDLSAERDGLAGAVISRAEAQALRLSMDYALLDGSCVITAGHLQAALELWAYCEASAAFLFGEASGDPVEDAIAAALRERGEMTRWEIYELLGRHASSSRIGSALQSLAVKGKARMTARETKGRPAEVWVWCASG